MSVSLTPEQKRLRFSADDDLCLLKEVLGQNPLQNPEKWHTIQANMKSITGKEFLIRTLKDHLCLLLSLWKKKTDGDQIRSGVEEIYSEKDKLLQEISDLCREFEGITPTKRRKTTKEKQIIQIGRQAREKLAYASASNENEGVFLGERNYVLPAQDSNIAAEITVGSEECLPSTSRERNEFNVVNRRNILAETSAETQTTNILKENASGIESPEKQRKILGPVRTRTNKSVVLRKNALEYLNKKMKKSKK